MAIDSEARIPVYINDEQAKAALQTLTGEAEKLRKKMADALAAGDMKGYKEAQKELNKVNREATALRKSSFDVNKVLENLSSASVKDLKKALSAVRKEQDGLNRDTEEYVALQRKADAINAELKKVNGTMVQQKGIMGNLIEGAKGLLPAFSFAAIAAAGTAAFNSIIKSTDTLGTEWDKIVGGMKSGLDQFWRTIASGDWSNFSDRMREAIRIGREYVAILDELEAKNRALGIAEADARKRSIELEDQVRNTTLSNEDRIKAAEERIKIEEELAEKRKQIAKEAFEAELSVSMQQTQLTRERLMAVLGDMDSETQQKANEYNELLKERQQLEMTGRPTSGFNKRFVYNEAEKDVERIKEIDSILAGMGDGVKTYAEEIRKTGNTTDEQLDKLVEKYGQMSDAEVSALENTRRVRSTMYSLLDEENRNRETNMQKRKKQEDDALKDSLSALDAAHEERLLKIEQQSIAEGKSQEWINIEKGLAERAYLEQKLAFLQAAGEQGIEIQRKLIERELDLIKQADEEIRRLREENMLEFEKFIEDRMKMENDALTKSVNANIASGKKAQSDSEKLQQEERERLADRADMILGFTQQMGDAFEEFLLSENKNFGEFLKNMLIQTLDFVENMMVMAIANETIKSIMEGAPINPLAVAKAAAKILLIKAAFGAAKTAFMGNQKEEGYQIGGYTGDGDRREPAGIVHRGEYVIPADGLENPNIRQLIDILESARINNQLRTMNLQPILPERDARYFQRGGFASSGNQTGSTIMGTTQTADPELKSLLRQNAVAIERLLEWKPKVYSELIKKDIDTLNEIGTKRGM